MKPTAPPTETPKTEPARPELPPGVVAAVQKRVGAAVGALSLARVAVSKHDEDTVRAQLAAAAEEIAAAQRDLTFRKA